MSFDQSQKQIDISDAQEVHTEKVLEYVHNPRNLRIMEHYDGKGEKTARIRKLMVTIMIYIKVRNDVIQDASYFSDSLGGLIHAYGSALTEMIKGKTLRETLWIRPEEVSRALDLPETGFGSWFKKALIEAINDYNTYRSAPWKKPYQRG